LLSGGRTVVDGGSRDAVPRCGLLDQVGCFGVGFFHRRVVADVFSLAVKDYMPVVES
jgi:hypothetical protein